MTSRGALEQAGLYFLMCRGCAYRFQIVKYASAAGNGHTLPAVDVAEAIVSTEVFREIRDVFA